MATEAIITGSKSLSANLSSKLHELLSRSPSAPSTSSSCSQVEEKVEELSWRLERIQALLSDAEEREIREKDIKRWLNELRDVAYDAEDVVEEFEYELQRYRLACGVEEQDQTTLEERECQIRSSHITTPCPSLHDASFQQQISDKIKEINNRLDEIYKDKCAPKFSEEEGQRHEKQNVERPPSSSLLSNSHVYGRNADEV